MYYFFNLKAVFKSANCGTSLMVQWLTICLPMQEVWVQLLLGELRSILCN